MEFLFRGVAQRCGTIRFIEQHKAGPFYVNIWSHISHHKIAPPASYVEKFKDLVVDESKFSAPMREKFAACKARGGDVSEHMRRYLADIYSMDEDIGRVLKRLDELGLRENTIVVFSSDQGPAPLESSAVTLIVPVLPIVSVCCCGVRLKEASQFTMLPCHSHTTADVDTPHVATSPR